MVRCSNILTFCFQLLLLYCRRFFMIVLKQLSVMKKYCFPRGFNFFFKARRVWSASKRLEGFLEERYILQRNYHLRRRHHHQNMVKADENRKLIR